MSVYIVIDYVIWVKEYRATYQRMVNKVYDTQIGKNLEVYMDDMITKSIQASDHVADLRETIMTLGNHQMGLNPDKCVLLETLEGSVRLRFLVDESPLRQTPDKIKAILDIKSLRSMKEVQKLTGCVAALGRLSNSANKCSPFFKTLRQTKFEWTEYAKKAFNKLKEYLASLPKLVSLA